MNTVFQPMDRWNRIPWRKLEKQVFKLQNRIYRASQRDDVKTVRKLQRLLLKSWAAKCLAVRRVTQDNQGRRTAGIDGVKSLKPTERLRLVKTLSLNAKATPLRRIWIPKTNGQRPLSIPTLHDRARQALVKLALEPEWEARFEPNSYGFRPGRSCHDAIEAIFLAIRFKPKYVLDADIAQCFDKISHDKLLDKLNTFPTLRRQIRAWLKAGVLDGNQLFPTSEGVPQGGPISPLLANICLHGMEEHLHQSFPPTYPYIDGKQVRIPAPALIRYADDLVVLHPDLAVVQAAQAALADWLATFGLTLKPAKTRITHTLHAYDGNRGFDFLGFHVRQYPAGKHQTGRCRGVPLGFKTLIKPAKDKVKHQQQRLAQIVRSHRAAPQAALIAHLNPVIRGWCRYYSTQASKRTFAKCAADLFASLQSWARRRHPKKHRRWVNCKYWHAIGSARWVFAARSKHENWLKLARHTDTPIQRFTKVQGKRSPYDGDWLYWAARRGQSPLIPARVAQLLKRQKGRCHACKLVFKSDDVIELDHIMPRSQGGPDEFANWQLLHRHCHHNKSAAERHSAHTREV